MDRPDYGKHPLRYLEGPVVERTGSVLQGVSFWIAIALTVAYLPLLVIPDLGVAQTDIGFLLAVHAIALIAGHRHLED